MNEKKAIPQGWRDPKEMDDAWEQLREIILKRGATAAAEAILHRHKNDLKKVKYNQLMFVLRENIRGNVWVDENGKIRKPYRKGKRRPRWDSYIPIEITA
jgi:hypothetical protein